MAEHPITSNLVIYDSANNIKTIDSRTIAKCFNKRHDHILRDIKKN